MSLEWFFSAGWSLVEGFKGVVSVLSNQYHVFGGYYSLFEIMFGAGLGVFITYTVLIWIANLVT